MATFVVEADVKDLQPAGAYQVGSTSTVYERSGDPDVERIAQPEFSKTRVRSGVIGATKIPDLPVVEPELPVPRRPHQPLKQRVQRQIAASVSAGKQASINGVKSAGRFAASQASAAYDWTKPVVSRHRWSLLSLSLLLAASATALGAVIWLSRVPPAPKCDKINILSSDAERLYCAQQAADTGEPDKLLAAIDLVKGWSADHPMYPQATSALAQWSEMLLIEARGLLLKNDLDGAVKLAQQIPEMSPLFKRAQEEIGFWQAERNRAQKLFEKIQTALRKQYWNEASGLLAKLALVGRRVPLCLLIIVFSYKILLDSSY